MMSARHSIREAQQTDLNGPSLYKDHAHHSLVPTVDVPQASECLKCVFSSPGQNLSQTLLRSFQLGWGFAFCLAHGQRLPSDIGSLAPGI